jgi:hypothetical protein
MQPSFDDLWTLFSRSHTAMLLEDYVKTHDVQAPKKMDFSTLARAQEDFEHLAEVLEQDLRIGEHDQTAEWCKAQGHESVLKGALWAMLRKTHDNPSAVIAAKALVITEAEKALAMKWS